VGGELCNQDSRKLMCQVSRNEAEHTRSYADGSPSPMDVWVHQIHSLVAAQMKNHSMYQHMQWIVMAGKYWMLLDNNLNVSCERGV
jgi:hypothetical protein